jgi:hypothetical protein
MIPQLPLRCRCGAVQGSIVDVAPERSTHVICYCDDCQAYIGYLERDDVLDAQGGSEIFQITPAQLRISSGAEQLRCMRLSEKGLLRWYTGCCKTPIANTMASARVPFAGMLVCFVDASADAQLRERALGPIVARAHGRYARGGMPEGAHRRFPLSWMLRIMRLQTRAWLEGKHRPSPFFDAAGAPVSAPVVLTPAQRVALRSS